MALLKVEKPTADERVITLDLDYCIGCRSCMAACYFSHYHSPRVFMGEVREEAILPLICRHCLDAPCVRACPNQAMKKEGNGVVRRSSALCVGCKSCAYACPFGVIDPGLKSFIINKCDLCFEALGEGKKPACVSSCVTGALKFEKLDNLSRNKKNVFLGARFLTHNRWKRRG